MLFHEKILNLYCNTILCTSLSLHWIIILPALHTFMIGMAIILCWRIYMLSLIIWLVLLCYFSSSIEFILCITVYPKKYAHVFCFAVLYCGYTLTDFPISIRLTSLALWQSNDCPSASKAALMNMDKYFTWIHYERLHNHNKAKHNKTVCIFLGIYCISLVVIHILPTCIIHISPEKLLLAIVRWLSGYYVHWIF